MRNDNILCIDLKSFFASCECVERGLNPYKENLIVASPERKGGAITLAVTPHLKSLGVKSRGRVYEIPKGIKYITAPPRMQLYINKSKEVINIYLDFIAPEDMHIYSIDEVFLDATKYLKLYKLTDKELALKILKTIYQKTGLTATCGIGPNMLIAKIAMDTEAKKCPDCIAKWTYENIPQKFWPIKPLSNFWGIGRNMEQKLNNLGIKSIYDLAHYNKTKLETKFGIMGAELWNHANGIDTSKIADFNSISKDQSYSHSQVLFKDYNENNIRIIIDEMIDVLCARLRKSTKQTGIIGLGIGYSKNIGGGFFHATNIQTYTDDSELIKNVCYNIFDKYYEFLPIRKVTVSFAKLTKKDSIQLNIFENIEHISNKENIENTIDEIKNKYGKNSLVKASALLDDSTIIESNKKLEVIANERSWHNKMATIQLFNKSKTNHRRIKYRKMQKIKTVIIK